MMKPDTDTTTEAALDVKVGASASESAEVPTLPSQEQVPPVERDAEVKLEEKEGGPETQQHQNTTSSEPQTYTCPMLTCNRGIKSEAHFQSHLLSCQSCKFCGMQYDTDASKHRKKKHFNGCAKEAADGRTGLTLQCQVCFCLERFNSRRELTEHVNTDHALDCTYPECRRSFGNAAALAGHRRGPVRLDECDTCKKVFDEELPFCGRKHHSRMCARKAVLQKEVMAAKEKEANETKA